MTLHKPLDVVRFAAQLISCAFFLVLTQQALAQQDVAEPEQSTALAASEVLSPFAALLENYCIECHSSDESAAGLNLEDFDTSKIQQSFAHDTGMWEKIARRVRGRQMPPANAELRPDEHEYQIALQALETALDQHAFQHPHPGRTDSIRRLNRTEYQHAIRDLLQLDVDVTNLLPADQSGHGFDNVTVGTLPPVLLHRYITAAEKIAKLAVGGQQRSPGGMTLRLPADRTQDNHIAGLPLGTRGGTLFKHHFPATGEYEIQLRLMRDRDEKIEGLLEQHQIDVLLDRDLVHQFTVDPPSQSEAWARDYTLLDSHLHKRFQVQAGPHNVGVTFPSKFSSLSENKRQPFAASFNRHRHPRKAPAIYEVSIVGPYNPEGRGDTPSRRVIFGDTIAEERELNTEVQAEAILRRLARLAFRRPVSDSDLVVPMRFFRQRFQESGFESGIEAALASLLVNPHFLFRAEVDPIDVEPGTPYRISDFELASRLSFFLWSSIPDEELLVLAEANELHQPDVLRSQVQRMLKDERSESLVSNFAAQWLYLRNLATFQPDLRLFADFDDNLRSAMRRETELLFENVMRQDRSVLNLIRSDTTYLNERLAKHYGIPRVFGSHFRAVKLSPDEHRGGLLRHGSILAVTSYSTRTSPTIRGNWILENILGTPPPPPPPNVPALKDKKTFEALTVRERLAEHRENPACASCHNLMDPVGFALENFDAVGRWRVFDDSQSIDSSGAMPDGQQIDSVQALEAGIIARPEMFVGTLTEKLLTFALGRGVEAQDGPAVRKVVRDAADNDYRFSSLVAGIALSTPFQMRVVE